MSTPIETREDLYEYIWQTVHRTPVVDMHTHLYGPGFGALLLRDIDELLTDHYLTAEALRYAPMNYDEWWALPKSSQAEYVWQHVFLEHSPVSEAARGVLTTLGLLGLDPGSRDLGAYREYFAARSTLERIDTVFARANVQQVVMTNNPFNTEERSIWLKHADRTSDARFLPALRVDTILSDWKAASKMLRGWGYEAKESCDKNARAEVRRFLEDWIDIMDPIYMAASLPPDFEAASKSKRAKLFRDCVLKVAEAHNLPVALMLGVKSETNPQLRDAGCAVGKSDIGTVEHICARYPQNKFFVTILSRENQHELCVAARKFSNLMPFGCWWFLNNPETITEITNMRTEMLGLSYIPQHSDARVLDQLLYKWAHNRWLIGHCLQEKYGDLFRTGWRVTEEEIARDVGALLGNNFKSFCKQI